MEQIKPAYVTIEQYESYCDLELMQFLYNKGFRFRLFTEGHRVSNNLAEQRFNEGDVTYCKNYITFSIVCEWLRVNHGIHIKDDFEREYSFEKDKVVSTKYRCYVNKFTESISGYDFKFRTQLFSTPQEAYSASFDYILNNLI